MVLVKREICMGKKDEW